MAERYDFYVHDNRKITFNLTEPIMREDSGVTDFVFHIPKILNELEVSDWSWWLVFVNAKKEKYSIALNLSEDPESPLEKNIGIYTVDYAMSIKAGTVQFALEAINTGTGGAIDNEWHTLTYETKVKETLQGNQAEYAETESDVISALLIEVRNKVTQLVGGATPLPVNLKSLMTDPQKVYLYTGSEQGEYTGNWYYHNGTQFVSGGVYGAGATDAVPTQGSTNAVSSGGVYDAISDLKEDLSITNIALGTAQNGYYSGNNGDTITFTSASNSRAYQIDLSAYIGKAVNVKITSGGSGSTRKTAICDSNGVIGRSETEAWIVAQANGITFDIDSTYNQLYISGYANGIPSLTITVTILDNLSLDILTLKTEVSALHKDTVYVDWSVSTSGDGSKTAPFKTIQEAINDGAYTVKVKAGTYDSITIINRDYPLTIMLDTMPTWALSTPEVKIYINQSESAPYMAVQISNCADIKIFDMVVDGSVMSDSSKLRACFNVENVQSIEMTRCYAGHNTVGKYGGFRLINVNGIFRNCVAHNITLDGFNIHGYGNTQFIDCVAHDCADDGISHHDSCTGSVIGGEFYNCGKGGVSTPYGGAKIDIHGVYSHDNTQYGLYCDSDSNHADIYARVEGCVFTDNGKADIYVSDGTVVGWNNIYQTKIVSETGTFTEFVNA